MFPSHPARRPGWCGTAYSDVKRRSTLMFLCTCSYTCYFKKNSRQSLGRQHDRAAIEISLEQVEPHGEALARLLPVLDLFR